MSHSLDRLLRLVKRTGDTLVVHNSQEDQDLVILNIDRYEDLVEGVSENREEEDSDWYRVGDLLQTTKQKLAPSSFEEPTPTFEQEFHEPQHHLEDVSSALVAPREAEVEAEEELRYEFPIEQEERLQSHAPESAPQPPERITPPKSVQQTQPVPQKSAPTDIDFSEEEPLQGGGPVFFEEPV